MNFLFFKTGLLYFCGSAAASRTILLAANSVPVSVAGKADEPTWEFPVQRQADCAVKGEGPGENVAITRCD